MSNYELGIRNYEFSMCAVAYHGSLRHEGAAARLHVPTRQTRGRSVPEQSTESRKNGVADPLPGGVGEVVDEGFDAVEAFHAVLHGGGVAQAAEALGLESDAGDDGDVLFGQEELGKGLRRLDHAAVVTLAEDALDVHHDVERTLGLAAGQAGDLVDALHHGVAAGLELSHHGLDALVTALQRLHGGILGDGVGVGGRMGLEGGDRLDLL